MAEIRSVASPGLRVARLRDPATIRARAGQIFEEGIDGRLAHFAVDLSRLEAAADLTVETIRSDYPRLDIPYHSRWRHFDVGGVDRWGQLSTKFHDDLMERSRAAIDLAVTSVLLDAGAGSGWSYRTGGKTYSRSEGLAVASIDLFSAGGFSTGGAKLRADAAALSIFDASQLMSAFQAGPDNPLVGADGRAALLRRLGKVIAVRPDLFGAPARVGNLVDFLVAQAVDRRLPAGRILAVLLDGLSDVWPARVVIDGINVGDVGRHPAVDEGLVPFHKLSQWLAYSLIEPLEWLGITVTDLDELTGLPEYRNGGLFLDTGVLSLQDPRKAESIHPADAELVVEWRALTVVLLDRLAGLVRQKLDLSAGEFPLAKVLQGGTWMAGRRIAARLRPEGGPPLRVESDGTIF